MTRALGGITPSSWAMHSGGIETNYWTRPRLTFLGGNMRPGTRAPKCLRTGLPSLSFHPCKGYYAEKLCRARIPAVFTSSSGVPPDFFVSGTANRSSPWFEKDGEGARMIGV